MSDQRQHKRPHHDWDHAAANATKRSRRDNLNYDDTPRFSGLAARQYPPPPPQDFRAFVQASRRRMSLRQAPYSVGRPLIAPWDETSQVWLDNEAEAVPVKEVNSFNVIASKGGLPWGRVRGSPFRFTTNAEATNLTFGVYVRVPGHQGKNAASCFLLWDLYLLKSLVVKIVDLRDRSKHHAERSELRQALALSGFEDSGLGNCYEFGLVRFVLEDGEMPSYFNTTKGTDPDLPRTVDSEFDEPHHPLPRWKTFDSGSEQMEFIEAAEATRTEMSLWVVLDRNNMPHCNQFERFYTLVNEVMIQSNDGKLRADWFASLDDKYSTSLTFEGGEYGYHKYCKTQIGPDFPKPPVWLQKNEANCVPRSRNVVSRFASLAAYSNLYTPAMLYETQFGEYKERTANFNMSREYHVKKRNIAGAGTLLMVQKPSGRSVRLTGGSVSVHLRNVVIQGQVMEKTDSTHLMVIFCRNLDEDARMELRNHGIGASNTYFPVKIVPVINDRRTINDANIINGIRTTNNQPIPHAKYGGNSFSWQDVIRGRRNVGLGPNFIKEWCRRNGDSRDKNIERMVREAFPKTLNKEQCRLFWLALTGTPESFTLLEGVPGSGKSRVLSILVAAMCIMLFKVIVTAQTNRGCDEVPRKTLAWIKGNPAWSSLEKHMLRIESGTSKATIFEELQKGTTVDEIAKMVGMPASNVKITIAYRTWTWLQANRNDEYAIRYMEFQGQMKRNAAAFLPRKHKIDDPNDKMGYSRVDFHVYKRAILDNNPLYITSTIASLQNFLDNNDDDLIKSPDMLIFDEAGQVTEPTFIGLCVALTPTTLILAGDPKQLPPHTVAKKASPYDRQLSVSPLQRLYAAKPTCARVLMFRNYRGDPDTVAMISAMFYNDLMISGYAPGEFPASDFGKQIGSLFARQDFCGGTFSRDSKVPSHLMLVKHDGLTGAGPRGSYCNPKANDIIMEMLRSIAQGDRNIDLSEICIVSPYQGDIDNLEDLIKGEIAANQLPASAINIRLTTVDSFQGGEGCLVILDMAASFKPEWLEDKSKWSRINPVGFTDDPQRLNVAVSRAQDWHIIIANVDYWRDRLEVAKPDARGLIKQENGSRRDRLPKCKVAEDHSLLRMMKFLDGREWVMEWKGDESDPVVRPVPEEEVEEYLLEQLSSLQLYFDADE